MARPYRLHRRDRISSCPPTPIQLELELDLEPNRNAVAFHSKEFSSRVPGPGPGPPSASSFSLASALPRRASPRLASDSPRRRVACPLGARLPLRRPFARLFHQFPSFRILARRVTTHQCPLPTAQSPPVTARHAAIRSSPPAPPLQSSSSLLSAVLLPTAEAEAEASRPAGQPAKAHLPVAEAYAFLVLLFTL